MKLGKSQRDKNPTEVASVAAFNPDGLLLLGKRNDNGKWVLPGGHAEPGEDRQKTAVRELYEEAGLRPESLEYLGEDTVEKDGQKIIVHCFRAEVDGDPTGKNDPDEECSQWEWIEPEEAYDYDLRDNPNCTLVRLGYERPLSKAQKNWRGRWDGVTIPVAASPDRRDWDQKFHQALVERFAAGDPERLVSLKVPIDAALQNSNLPVNQDRLRLYRRMAQAGDRLPPIVVRRSGKGFNIVDGNHRHQAAQDKGLKELDAYELLDPVKKALGDIPVGKRLRSRKKDSFIASHPGPYNVHDYTHVLSPERQAAGYKLKVYDAPTFLGARLEARLIHNDKTAGGIQALHGHEEPNEMEIGHARLDESHQSKGLGLAMYEALLAHGKNKLGATHLVGGTHSTQASRVHQRLAEKHGLEYEPIFSDAEKNPVGPFDERFADYRYALKAEEHDSLDLEKALWPSLLTAAALATSPVQERAAEPVEAGHPAKITKIKYVDPPKWTPEGMHPELKPIAHLESNFGLNVEHEKHSGGPYHTALGALGLKPITAHETYKHSPTLQKLYPGLDTPEKFVEKLHSDPRFYNINASAHWRYLKRILGDALKAAYGWRHGLGAAQQADDYQLKTDPYVQKFQQLHDAQVVRSIRKSEDDQLMTLLDNDDVMERRLALKHRDIKPTHLRQALNDEDPEIRALAAAHPKMSEELLRESLYHDDPLVREVLAQRPDLQGHHLEVLLNDPEVQVTASRHPALTLEQRQKLTENPETPAGLREEMLQKNIGYILYPNFGVHQLPTEPMVLPKTSQQVTQARAMGHTKAAAMRMGMKGIRGGMTYSFAGNSPIPGPRRKLAGFVKLPGKTKNPADWASHVEDLHLQGTVGHEAQHGAFGKLAQNIGEKGKREVIRRTIGSLDEAHRQALQKVFTAQAAYDPKEWDEENLAYVHNYLQDPGIREHVHQNNNLDVRQGREMVQAVRRAWQQMQRFGQTLKPEDLGGQYPLWARLNPRGQSKTRMEELPQKKSEIETLRAWSRRLAKTDHTSEKVDTEVQPKTEVLIKTTAFLPRDDKNIKDEDETELAQELLGWSEHVDQVLAAAHFLAGNGKEIDENEFRRCLWEHDGDVEAAALAAYGLPDCRENRDALKGLLVIRDTQKDEAPWNYDPHVVALVPEGEKTARKVEAGLRAHEVKALELKGKHSKGALMVTDPEGRTAFLLKPGSGRTSPAQGVREERASQSKREAAFWHVAENWGLGDSLPRADLLLVEEEKKGQKKVREYAAISFLGRGWRNLDKTRSQHPNLGRMAMQKYLRNGTLHKWAVLDGILSNPDRHSQNLMISNEELGSKLKLIDHGSAFAGLSFDPVHDGNSFTPYYLRVWHSNSKVNFNSLTPEERFEVMPRVNHETEELLRQWLAGISEHQLESTLLRYGINPLPEVLRLRKLKDLSARMPVDKALNMLWSGLDTWTLNDQRPNLMIHENV